MTNHLFLASVIKLDTSFMVLKMSVPPDHPCMLQIDITEVGKKPRELSLHQIPRFPSISSSMPYPRKVGSALSL